VHVQVPALRSVAHDAQQRAELAEERQNELQKEVQRLQTQLGSAQQRLLVLKDQLMTGQAEAEACEQQMVQDAIERVEVQWRQQLQVAQDEVRAEFCCTGLSG
jgi:chromosome segregation ATPase